MTLFGLIFNKLYESCELFFNKIELNLSNKLRR